MGEGGEGERGRDGDRGLGGGVRPEKRAGMGKSGRGQGGDRP